MRRLLTDPADYLRHLARDSARAWDAFFFTPADPTPLGLMRLIVGSLLTWNLLVLGLDLHAFVGPTGWVEASTLRQVQAERMPWAWSFWPLVPGSLTWAVWALCLVVTIAFALGLASRFTAVLAWAVAVATARRMPFALYGFDQVITTWALYLAATGASGQAVSLDRFFARRKLTRTALARPGGSAQGLPSGVPQPTISANLALRLVQLHLCLIYAMAGLAKLRGDAWWTGFAVWGVLAAGEFRRFNLTWLAAWPALLNLMTLGGLALELGYPVLIWVRRLRPLLITLAIGLHLGIDLALGLTEFGLAMLAGNLAFVSGPWLRSLVAGRPADQPAGTVLYDGACPVCRRSVALLLAADPDHVVATADLNRVDVKSIHPSLTPEACTAAMHLVSRDGSRVWQGFDALARLASWLPLFWPLGLLARVPGVAIVGRRVYNHLAARRRRETPCTDDACSIDPPPAPSGRARDDRVGGRQP
jgi:predicted DCC family thiol-disulfide oxidoreductase YuxK